MRTSVWVCVGGRGSGLGGWNVDFSCLLGEVCTAGCSDVRRGGPAGNNRLHCRNVVATVGPENTHTCSTHTQPVLYKVFMSLCVCVEWACDTAVLHRRSDTRK